MNGRLSSVGVDARERQPWIDIAKSYAIVLVVVYHVSATARDYLLFGADSIALSIWESLSAFLVPIRMPLFFLMAGVLAAPAVGRSWRLLVATKVANLIWPYLLWSIAFCFVVALAVAPHAPLDPFLVNLRAILYGGTAYWFLSALALFFIVARWLRGIRWVLVIASLLLLVLAPTIDPYLSSSLPGALATNADRWNTLAFWFFLGCFGRDGVLWVARLPLWPWLPIAGTGLLVTVWLRYGLQVHEAAWMLATSLFGLFLAVQLSVLSTRSTRLVRMGRAIGSRTLAIYLVHPMVLWGLVAVSQIARPLPKDWLFVNVAFVPGVTVLLVALSLFVYQNSQSGWTRLLFSPPRAVSSGVRYR